ncbi:MAG: regulatory protein RecX [Anaerolineae bacterium]
MARIVSIVSMSGRGERYEVHLDDGTFLELAGIIAVSLSCGQELSVEQRTELTQRDFEETAYEKTLNYLSYRSRSEHEIETYLVGKRLGTVSSAVIARLKRAGLVDDSAFARQWVENRSTFHPRGKWALQAELRHAGISKEIIEESLETVDEAEGALRAGERKAWQLRDQEKPVFRQRLLAFLQRKGFSYDVAERSVKALWQQVCSAKTMQNENERDNPDI